MPSARPAQNAVRRPLDESCSAAAASAVRSADSRIGWYGCCASAGLATRAIASATETTFIVTILLGRRVDRGQSVETIQYGSHQLKCAQCLAMGHLAGGF